MVQAPHSLGGETEAEIGRVCVKHHRQGVPTLSPTEPNISPQGFLPPRTPTLIVVTLGGFETPLQSQDEKGPKISSLIHKTTWKNCTDISLTQSGSVTRAALGERPHRSRVVKDGPCGCFLVQLIN